MDAEFRRVKPKEGLKVRYPRNYAILPEAGAVVPWIGPDGRYWRRRFNSGDVVVITEDSSPTLKEAKPYVNKRIKEEN